MVKTNFSKKLPAASSSLVIALGYQLTKAGVVLATDASDFGWLSGLNFEALGATGRVGAITLLPFESSSKYQGATLALFGLGSSTVEAPEFREIGGNLATSLNKHKTVALISPTATAQTAEQLLEGFLLADYAYTAYKGTAPKKSLRENLIVITAASISTATKSRLEIMAKSVHDTRDLVNQPPNDLYPASFTAAVQKGTRGLGLTVQVWDEKALKTAGFGGISAVGQGSSRPPRLVKISYAPNASAKHLALVGKGITFDSGGLSLKPAESMVGMKYDMTGAATVYQAVVAIAKLGLPVRVTAWLCLAENMPSAAAQRPNDVIKIRNGKTVEVLNTDAEGRLVLADGLSAASEEFPDLIVDVATLTGAATIALGNRYSGLMGDTHAVQAIESAAKVSGELVWHMPLAQELRALLDSDIADIANVKIGNRAGGMLIGGLFLKEFIGPISKKSQQTIPWAHLDIAGPANNDSSAYGFTPKGGTGAYVRTLVALAEQIAKG